MAPGPGAVENQVNIRLFRDVILLSGIYYALKDSHQRAFLAVDAE